MKEYLVTARPLRDDELMHWKYVHKTTVNGKVRYYYTDTDLDKAKADMDSAHDNMRAAANRYGRDRIKELGAFGSAKSKREQAARRNARYNSEMNLNQANAKYKKAIAKYKTQKIKSFAPGLIGKGVAIVANLLSKAFAKGEHKTKVWASRMG